MPPDFKGSGCMPSVFLRGEVACPLHNPPKGIITTPMTPLENTMLLGASASARVASSGSQDT